MCEKQIARQDSSTAVLSQIALGIQEQLVKIFLTYGRRVVIIAGPTGVGKTEFALQLAKLVGGEIVSADSMQVYRGMDIGTAKVSAEARLTIPHHLIDICDISEEYNVFQYCTQAKMALEDIIGRGKIPLVVGGTGLYIHSLIYGPPGGPPSNPSVRARLEHDMERLGSDVLFQALESFDPAYAAAITRNDRHKIIRALEIIEISGRRVSDFSWKNRRPIPFYDFHCWFLSMPRSALYERLSKRCYDMLNNGFLDEVRSLDQAGIRKNQTARQAIGYRQALEFLDSDQSQKEYETFIQHFIQASHRLAKRQYTWFRKEPCFQWVDVSQKDLLDHIASDCTRPTL